MNIELCQKFTFWVMERDNGKGKQSWGQNLKQVLTVSNCQQFWEFFQYLRSMNEMSDCDISLFKQSVKPKWQDPANVTGRYFQIKIGKKKANKLWQNAVFSLVTPNNEFIDLINGIRFKIRERLDYLQIWMNIKCLDKDRLVRFQNYLKQTLQVTDQRAFILLQFGKK